MLSNRRAAPNRPPQGPQTIDSRALMRWQGLLGKTPNRSAVIKLDELVKTRIFRFVRVSGRDFGGGEFAGTRRKLLKQLAIFNAFPKIAPSPETLNGAQN